MKKKILDVISLLLIQSLQKLNTTFARIFELWSFFELNNKFLWNCWDFHVNIIRYNDIVVAFIYPHIII